MRSAGMIAMAFGLLPLIAVAQQRTIIRHASQLANDAAVKEFIDPVQTLSSIYVIHTQCGTDLGITQAQKTYLTDSLKETTRQYLQAYDTAFQSRVGIPSPKELVVEYADIIKQQQQAAADNMAKVIKQRGCKNSQITALADYAEKLRQQALKSPPKASSVAPAAATTTTPGVASGSAPPAVVTAAPTTPLTQPAAPTTPANAPTSIPSSTTAQ